MGELEDNLKAFEEQFKKELPRLLAENESRFAVVGRKSSEEDYEFECWDTFNDAYQYGCKQYGLKLFLIKQVLRFEIPITFTRYILPFPAA